MTRGHKRDAIVIEEVLKVPHRYVGMIGSKRKVHIIYETLKVKDIDEKLLAAVHAPIGININAETPEEITGVSAAEQTLQVMDNLKAVIEAAGYNMADVV